MVANVKEKAGDISEKSGDALKKAAEGAKKVAGKVKEKTEGAVNKAKEAMSDVGKTASNLATNAGNLVSMNGSANMKLDGDIDFGASFIRVVKMADGSNVVQIKSYKDGQDDSYPSFFIQGKVEQANVDDLNGQKIACQLFAQLSPEAAVFSNAAGEPITIQFGQANKTILATFSNASIVNLNTGAEVTSNGMLECVKLD